MSSAAIFDVRWRFQFDKPLAPAVAPNASRFAGRTVGRSGVRYTVSSSDRRRASPARRGARLHVNQYRIASLSELDDTFAALIGEAYLVGRGTQ